MISKKESETRQLEREADRFAVCTDIKIIPLDYKKFLPGHFKSRGYPLVWFHDRDHAKDYLSRNRIIIDRVYISELEEFL